MENWQSDKLLKMADLVYTGRFDLNPTRNTREKLQLPLSDIAAAAGGSLHRGDEPGGAL